jgi:site-specific DNA recombinase
MSHQTICALYARVSSPKQAKDCTIDSQIQTLKEKIASDGELLIDNMVFSDAGVSGATLIRPELERLRDAISIGAVDQVYIHSPDRLSRKYAHQALLLEEFSSAGVVVHFLNHKIGASPEEEMLLQMQGMFAEYERAKIIERHRRGKLHRARVGSVNVLSGAPYGYRYTRRQLDGQPAQYVIDLEQAKTVRLIFNWIGVDRHSIGAVCRRLGEANIPTKTGKKHWDRNVVWGMLQNPAYMGKAAFGKTKAGTLKPRIRPAKHSAETPKKSYSTHKVERKDWIEIPVPPIISEQLYEAVQAQLDENRKRARVGERGAKHLLQGLAVCGHCHYAFYGKRISPSTAKGKFQYAYYRCIGTDAYRFGGQRICDNKQVRTQMLDDVVWAEVINALENPARLKNEYERRLGVLEKDEHEKHDTSALKRQKAQLEKGASRLIDSYASSIIDQQDFEPKIKQIKARIAQIDEQIEQGNQSQSAQRELFLVINHLEEFAKTINVNLATTDFITKRDTIRALVKRVEIYKDEVVVIFRIDPAPPHGTNSGTKAKSDNGDHFMHSCKGRKWAALRNAKLTLLKELVIDNPSSQVSFDQS